MIFVLFALAVVIVIAFYSLRHASRREPNLANEDLAAEMRSRATSAVETAASKHRITLDYSRDSVAKVEEILATVHECLNQEHLSEEQVVRESLRWGGYIGEVIRRIKPCHWELDSEIGGEGSFPIVFEKEQHETFPVRWCYKRIKNGPEDNVWHKFTLMAESDSRQLRTGDCLDKPEK